MNYNVVIERTSNNFAAYVPDLPGCVSTANTWEAFLEEIREAIEFHIEGTIEDCEPMQDPRATEHGLTRLFAPGEAEKHGSRLESLKGETMNDRLHLALRYRTINGAWLFAHETAAVGSRPN